MFTHRALVTYSNESTGEIRVKIPALTGLNEISISYFGREAVEGVWTVPAINDEVVVSFDDANLTNVFWVRIDEPKKVFYCSLYDTSTQSASATNIPVKILFNNIAESYGFTLVDNSRIVVKHSGTYNIQFSIQFSNSANNVVHNASVWLRKNGVNMPNSSSYITVPGKHSGGDGKTLATVTFVLTFASDDFIEVYWSTLSTTVTIATIAANTIDSSPVSPAVIFSMHRIIR